MAKPTQSDAASKVIAFVSRKDKKPVTYALTSNDYVTLVRAIEFEGPPQEAVAWTLLQRFAFLYPLYDSLARFITAYAQPINPAWFPTGALHLEWAAKLRKAGRDDEAAKEDIAAIKRASRAALPLTMLSTRTINAVNRVFAQGSKSPVPGAVHYRAPTVKTTILASAEQARASFARTKNMRDIGVGDARTDNWFFSQEGSSGFQITPIAKEIGGAAIMLLVSAGLLYWMYRSQYA